MTAELWVSVGSLLFWLLTIVALVLRDRWRRSQLWQSHTFLTVPAVLGESLVISADRSFTATELEQLRQDWRRAMEQSCKPGVIMLPPGCQFTRIRDPHGRLMVGADIGVSEQ